MKLGFHGTMILKWGKAKAGGISCRFFVLRKLHSFKKMNQFKKSTVCALLYVL